MAFGNATKGYVRAHSSGGGGGGTSDYSQLSNKPSINGVTLSGNKTSSDLGIGGITRTLLNQNPVTSIGSTDIDIRQYKYIEIVSGVYASGKYQVFTNIVSVDDLTTTDYELICGGVHPNDPAYSVWAGVKAVNNILNIFSLVVRGWSETPTVFKIVGIK